MLVITVSKKVAAAVAVVVLALIIGGAYLALADDGSSKDSSRAADASQQPSTVATSPTCPSTTTPTSVVETAAPAVPSGRGWTGNGNLGASNDDPGVTATPFQAAVYSTASEPYAFDATSTLADTTTSGSGALDLASSSIRVDVSSGGATTEIRQIGDVAYVDAARLGSTGSQWVALDTVAQSSQMSVRAVENVLTAMSPAATIDALVAPLDVALVGTDATGTHYRATIVRSGSSFVPLVEVFGTSDSTTTPVDVWVDPWGHINRIVVVADGATTTYTLGHFGDPVTIAVPTDVGDLSSTSGTFVFGNGLPFSPQSVTPHSLTVTPTIALNDGIVTGTLGATSATGEEIRSTFVSSTNGGKFVIGDVPDGQNGTDPQSFTALPYATWMDMQPKGTETFVVRVGEVTAVDRYLLDIPLFGTIASPVIDHLQDSPTFSTRLAPTIGVSTRTNVVADMNALAPADTPVAFTYDVRSFDGVAISTNFFPASGLAAGQVAPTVLSAAALGEPGTIDAYASRDAEWSVPGPAALRQAIGIGDVAFNVVTWDPRGEFDSGGVLQFDNPFFEGRDVSAIIDWVASSTPAELNGANDPAVGMVGGSYGGGIQLTAAGTEPRIDAIVPVNAWNSLPASLQSGGALDTRAAATLLSKLSRPEIRMSESVRGALLDGLFNGRLSEHDVAVLSNSDVLLGQSQAPTLLIQSTTDRVVPLGQSIANAQSILANPYGVPTKLIWFDGSTVGQGVEPSLYTYTKIWLDKYVVGIPIPDAAIPTFQWWDQNGDRYTSTLMPFDQNFETTPISASSVGGTLTIAPAGGTVTSISVPLTVPAGTQIVGSPTVSFTYTGQGTAHAVFGRIVDTSTGHVLSAEADGIPVVLDGTSHNVTIDLDAIAYTGLASGGLRLELLSSTDETVTDWWGTIAITALGVHLPVRAF